MKLKKENLDSVIHFLESYCDKEAIWNMFYKEKTKNSKNPYIQKYLNYKPKINNDNKNKNNIISIIDNNIG